MSSSGMLRRVVLVKTDVSEELSAFIIRVARIDEIGTLLVTANVVPNLQILFTLMMEALSSSETSVLTRVTRRHSLHLHLVYLRKSVEERIPQSVWRRAAITFPPGEGDYLYSVVFVPALKSSKRPVQCGKGAASLWMGDCGRVGHTTQSHQVPWTTTAKVLLPPLVTWLQAAESNFTCSSVCQDVDYDFGMGQFIRLFLYQSQSKICFLPT
jgi:hypothetical protein